MTGLLFFGLGILLLALYLLFQQKLKQWWNKENLSSLRGLTSDSFPIDMTNGKCPDCNSKKFKFGPEGGTCVNIKCSGCGSEFNLEQVTMCAHRINRKS